MHPKHRTNYNGYIQKTDTSTLAIAMEIPIHFSSLLEIRDILTVTQTSFRRLIPSEQCLWEMSDLWMTDHTQRSADSCRNILISTTGKTVSLFLHHRKNGVPATCFVSLLLIAHKLSCPTSSLKKLYSIYESMQFYSSHVRLDNFQTVTCLI